MPARTTVSPILSAALAGTLGFALPAAPAAAGPDKTFGMALMSAFVTPNGALAGGVGATGAAPLNTGFYRVTFDRSVEDCNFVASVGRADGIINPIGVASAWWDSGEDAVLVFTSDFDGSLADHPFQVIVFCAG